MSKQAFIRNANPHPAKYYPIFAVDEHEQIIGEVYVYIIGTEREVRAYAYIDNLKVVDEERGKGIARQLMQRAHDIAQREECYKIVANSHRTRKEARMLYASLGYVPHGREFRLNLKK